MLRPLLSVVVVFLAGCDKSAMPLPPAGIDGPKIVLEPSSGLLRFDESLQGGPAVEAEVRVSNVGTRELNVTVDFEGRDADLFDTPQRQLFVAPGASHAAVMTLTPRRIGNVEAKVVFTTNDAALRTTELDLQGVVVGSCLEVVPQMLAFEFGETKDVVVTSKVAGCMLTELRISNGSFTVLDPPTLPALVGVSTPLTLEIRHDRTRLPRPMSTLRMSASDGSATTIALSGPPPVRGCFTTPRGIGFGGVDLGGEARRTETIVNDCAEPAVITGGVVTGPSLAFSFTTNQPFPVTLPPRAGLEITIRYRPTVRAPFDQAAVVLTTNDVEAESVIVNLYGDQTKALPDLFPSRLRFGETVVGCPSRSRALRVFNDGEAKFTIERLELDGADFEVETITVAGAVVAGPPFEVPGRSAAYVRLRLAESAGLGDRRAALRVHHDADAEPFRAVLEATVTETASTTERFEQSSPAIDVLWVLDDTASAQQPIETLRAAIPTFLSMLGTNYQMGVTRLASNSLAGDFMECGQHPQVIAGDYADIDTQREAIECMFDRIRFGSAWFERGMFSSKRALEKVIDPFLDPNPVSGFLRDNAQLVVIIASTDDDQSTIQNETFLEFLASARDDRLRRSTVFAIAGPVDRPCELGARAASPGYRYRRIATVTGGEFYDICEHDLGPTVANIATRIMIPRDEWTLAKPADPTTIVVRLDGAQLPSNAFVFEPEDNVVRLTDPPPGARIEVTYDTACPE